VPDRLNSENKLSGCRINFSSGLRTGVILIFFLLSGYCPGNPDEGRGQNLQPQQGRYFRWAAPPGWQVSETNAGVTLTSPDGQLSASLAMLLRSRGSRTPQAFLSWVFSHVPNYRNCRVLAVRNLPNQRMSYQVWQFIEASVSYLDNGLPVTGVYKVGVANYYGLNDAMIVGYRAANPLFQQAQSFLPRIAQSIVLTNALEAGGNNTLIRPKNNPLDNSGLIKSGQYRDRVREHASEGWREGMMGTEPTMDPKTGQTYNSPLNSYNPARGGYVNPQRPNELLVPNHK
jgi:hypothetical protein